VDVDLWVATLSGQGERVARRRDLERRVLAPYLGCAPEAVEIDRRARLPAALATAGPLVALTVRDADA
jgi:hypothetical protein